MTVKAVIRKDGTDFALEINCGNRPMEHELDEAEIEQERNDNYNPRSYKDIRNPVQPDD